MKVFICYAREDFDIAKKLYQHLIQAGITPWIDSEDILPGQEWWGTISNAIKESQYFLLLFSSKSLNKKGFVQKEIKMAMEILDQMPQGNVYIIPVRLDECKPKDEKIKKLHWCDLFPYEEGLKKILKIFNIVLPEAKLVEETKPIVSGISPIHKLRKEPVIISIYNAQSMFQLNDWRPIEYIKNKYKSNRDGTITDYSTGLMWQRSGSSYLIYQDAHYYIRELNLKSFANNNDWRLPTVDELKSLLNMKKNKDNKHISPQFSKDQHSCWTVDKVDSVRGEAWSISFVLGYIIWDELRVPHCVRAVRSIEESLSHNE